MHYLPTTEEQDDALFKDVERLLPKRTLDALKKAVADALHPVLDDAIEVLKSDVESGYQDVAINATRKLLGDVLAGDEAAARLLFAADGYDDRCHHALIHGKIHEPMNVELRHKLVAAHADLLISERIKDLEALIENLRNDIAGLKLKNEHLRNR